jgi:ABC-type transporter Mla subunit MlaD
MALQDLTPQLRTRLSRMERAVGWFVILATALLVFGFGYYVYHTAERKGWFITKINYQTSIASGAGLKEGDPVKLMGFDVGEITRIQANDPYAYYNITVDFRIKAPNYGYLWSDSKVKVAAGDFLGHRYLEITKGVEGAPTVNETTNKEPVGMLKRDYLIQRQNELSKQFTNRAGLFQALNAEAVKNKSLFYTALTKKSVYWLEPEESPALTERLEKLVGEVEKALPNILSLTNQLAVVLSNSVNLTSNLNAVASDARPAVSNLAVVTAQLNQPGALGEWLLPTNLNQKLDTTLTTANTNLAVVAQNLNRSLENLANITSNLNSQVQANTNILSQISRAIVDADNLVQGLKRHWLLRSAFKKERTNAPARTPAEPLLSPKAK